MKVLVFDLDDTLFNMLDFYRGGDLAVAKFIEKKWGVPYQKAYREMIKMIENKKAEKIFDQVLEKYSLYSKKAVQECLAVYRAHKPKISLYADAKRCLKKFKKYPIYVVTDGNKLVQHNKIVALGLPTLIKKAFITHRHGRKNAKPSPYCFAKIARIEKVDPKEVVYIGDNPNKDFVGIKPLGFRTIRVLRGFHRATKLAQTHEAHHLIHSLDELEGALKKL